MRNTGAAVYHQPAKKTPMPAKKSKAQPKDAAGTQPVQRRLWLMYPPKFITTPVIWNLARKFPVVTNVRQASVTDEIGIVCLELSGQRPDVKAAIKWLEELGIKVEPVEIGVIES
jgi:ABC-type methionine transport system ATPase subunit